MCEKCLTSSFKILCVVKIGREDQELLLSTGQWGVCDEILYDNFYLVRELVAPYVLYVSCWRGDGALIVKEPPDRNPKQSIPVVRFDLDEWSYEEEGMRQLVSVRPMNPVEWVGFLKAYSEHTGEELGVVVESLCKEILTISHRDGLFPYEPLL